LFEKKIKFIMR